MKIIIIVLFLINISLINAQEKLLYYTVGINLVI